jgi:hypothetical protein
MGADGVVVTAPAFDDDLSFPQQQKCTYTILRLSGVLRIR